MYNFIIILFLSFVNISFVYAECEFQLKDIEKNNNLQSKVDTFRSENEYLHKCKILVVYSKKSPPVKWIIAEINEAGEFNQISFVDYNILSAELKKNPINIDKIKALVKSKLHNCVNIKFYLWSAGIGIGGTWGDGQFTIGTSPNEQTYYFTASGFSLAEVGVAKFNTNGEICGIKNEDDIAKFSGIYSGGGFGIALLPGYGIWGLVNQNGVKITLNSSFLGIFIGFPLKSLILELK